MIPHSKKLWLHFSNDVFVECEPETVAIKEKLLEMKITKKQGELEEILQIFVDRHGSDVPAKY